MKFQQSIFKITAYQPLYDVNQILKKAWKHLEIIWIEKNSWKNKNLHINIDYGHS